MKRRQFVKASTAVTLGAAMGCKPKKVAEVAAETGLKIDQFGIQLWTVRDAMAIDPKSTLKTLSEYGYHHIESFQGEQGIYWGMDAKTYRSYLGDLGMKTISSHCANKYTLDPTTKEEFKALVDEAAEVGIRYLINPWMGNLKTLEEFKMAAEGIAQCAMIADQSGIKYGYHNHAYSFTPIEGTYPQDILMEGTEGTPAVFEMDIYWVVAAKEDPIQWFKKHHGRWKLSHIKDRYPESKLEEIKAADAVESYADINGSCVLGTGQIDFKEVLTEAQKQGMDLFIVEQERYDNMTSMEASKLNANYMQQFVG